MDNLSETRKAFSSSCGRLIIGALQAHPKALQDLINFAEHFVNGLLFLMLEKLPTYGRLFSSSCGGLQPSAARAQWGPTGPKIGPFGPT